MISCGIKNFSVFILGLTFLLPAAAYGEAANTEEKPITLKTMGSLFFGGSVAKRENGETFHGDHGYAQYYIPQNSRNFPIIMWHGIGQSGRSFESTPDGREGYQAILAREDWPVYIIDQPRRGRAGRTLAAKPENDIPTIARESGVWNAFRMGKWTPPDDARLYPGIQARHDGYAVDQFMRQQTGDTGELPRTAEHRDFLAATVKQLLDQTGDGILLTHSYAGHLGWAAGMAAPDKIKAIVAYEPGHHVFPEGEEPAPMESAVPGVNDVMKPQIVPLAEFEKLARMPIILVYGDNIRETPGDVFNEEVWRISLARAKEFVAAVNRHGGDAALVHLPELGIKGNTHAPFADLNNKEIAGLLTRWLKEKGLDGRDKPHQGPKRPTLPLSIPLQE